MSAQWGNSIKYTIFGESHGAAIGIVIDGLAPGIELDIAFIKAEMERRAPGNSPLTTPRKEKDQFEILSGYYNGKTTGAPLSVIIRNTNQRSGDYSKHDGLMRPGHADYSGYIKYKGFNDFRGGGHFSGRMTAPIVFAGAVAKQILLEKNIIIGSHIYSLLNINDFPFELNNVDSKLLSDLTKSKLPLLNKALEQDIYKTVEEIRSEKDSVGGIIEVAAANLPAGIGDPFFNSMESQISHLIFSIPGIKGIEFGEGFNITKMKGSEANDSYNYEGDKVTTSSNHNGGILGGITNGRPLIFRCAVKPTASIEKEQNTINVNTKENDIINIVGRHDPCILFRAIPVVEAVTAIAILENLTKE